LSISRLLYAQLPHSMKCARSQVYLKDCKMACIVHRLIFLDSRVALPSQDSPSGNHYCDSTKPGAIPELYDIPIGMVNSVLYHKTILRAATKAQKRRGGTNDTVG